MSLTRAAIPAVFLLLAFPAAGGETRRVGPGQPHARIEEAVAAARPGDVIEVHPLPEGRPYEKVAVQVRLPGLVLRAARAEGGPRVVISGEGFDYSGKGKVPRAIIQLDRGAHGAVIEGFELTGARNGSRNGAGVRILEADRVTVRDCDIHGNDMGIMSSGDGTARSAVDQRIEGCRIHANGSPKNDGRSHNLYLAGGSVTLSGCEVWGSVSGHNVKSRAHRTVVEYCYIHDSANRELDLVDGKETEVSESHAVLLGNVIVKARELKGNKAVIHFGQDGGRDRCGRLHLIHNTIVTPHQGAVVDLSAPGTSALLVGNLIHDGGTLRRGQVLATAREGARLSSVTAVRNWLARGFGECEGIRILPLNASLAATGPRPSFCDPRGHDWRPTEGSRALIGEGLPRAELIIPPLPGRDPEPPLAWQYHHPAGKAPRPHRDPPTVGAHEN